MDEFLVSEFSQIMGLLIAAIMLIRLLVKDICKAKNTKNTS